MRDGREGPEDTKDAGRFDGRQILPEEVPAPIWLENSHLEKKDAEDEGN